MFKKDDIIEYNTNGYYIVARVLEDQESDKDRVHCMVTGGDEKNYKIGSIHKAFNSKLFRLVDPFIELFKALDTIENERKT